MIFQKASYFRKFGRCISPLTKFWSIGRRLYILALDIYIGVFCSSASLRFVIEMAFNIGVHDLRVACVVLLKLYKSDLYRTFAICSLEDISCRVKYLDLPVVVATALGVNAVPKTIVL